jgi:methyltransferase (TIGR00027 family)
MKPISQTAFYCCGVRMQDAELDKPVCGDVYAKTFMNEDGLRILEQFKDETHPNTSNVARHRAIDDILRDELRANPNLTVIIIGAGFDSRAYRLKGGTWVELDEPQVIAYKDERLPVSRCENKLTRIAIDFSTDSLEQKLHDFAGRAPVVVVIEGVFMYLDDDTIRQLLQTLRRLFPQHKLVCDLMTKSFFKRYGRTIREKLGGLGATINVYTNDPTEVFRKSGYELKGWFSIIVKSLEYQSKRVPKIILNTLLRTLTRGYAIYIFEVR